MRESIRLNIDQLVGESPGIKFSYFKPGIHEFYPDYKLPQTTNTCRAEHVIENKIIYEPTS